MKKGYLFLVTVAIGFTSIAQEETEVVIERPYRLTYGVKAGANLSGVWNAAGQDFSADTKYGFAGGVFLGIPLGRFLGLQPEMMYSQKGFTSTGTLIGAAYFLEKTNHFIDMPMQLQFKPLPFMTILAGPQMSFLVLEDNVYILGGAGQKSAFDDDNRRICYLGGVAGIDLNFYHLVISGRAGWDFQNNKTSGRIDTPKYRNQYVQLTLGFRL